MPVHQQPMEVGGTAETPHPKEGVGVGGDRRQHSLPPLHLFVTDRSRFPVVARQGTTAARRTIHRRCPRMRVAAIEEPGRAARAAAAALGGARGAAPRRTGAEESTARFETER